MRKTHKKVLGLLGLVLVVATTVFAATLPGPEASAVTNSVTDTITVRVVGAVPDVNIKNIENGEVLVAPLKSFGIDYENVDTVTVTLQYTDKDGVVHTYPIDSLVPDYVAGSGEYNLDLDAEGYGYGEYVLTVRGIGYDGVSDEDIRKFSYYPLYAEATEDEETGNYNLDLTYKADDGTEDGGKVAKIEINVYDENGKLVEKMSPIKVTPPTTQVKLPFADLGLPSGKYTVAVSAYDKEGEKLYKDFLLTIDYEAITVPKTADTGGLFQSLNISKMDYLATGLIIFFLVAIGGVVFIAKTGKKKAPARVNMRKKTTRKRR